MTREECQHWRPERLGPDRCDLDIPGYSYCYWTGQREVADGRVVHADRECPRSVAYRRGREAQEERGAE